RTGREIDERVQDLLHPKVIDRGAKEHRSLPSSQERLVVELGRCALDQFDFIVRLGKGIAKALWDLRILQAVDELVVVVAPLLAALEHAHSIPANVVDPLERAAHAYGPGKRD